MPYVIAALLSVAGAMWMLAAIRGERRRGWRMVPAGRDEFRYEEWQDGRWRGMRVYAELRSGRPSRLVDLPTADDWRQDLPDWPSERVAQATARIRAYCASRGYAIAP